MQAITSPSTSATEGVVVRSAVKAGGSFQSRVEGVVGEAAAGTTDCAQRWGRHHRFQRRRARHRAGGDVSPATWPVDADGLVIEF